MNWNSPAELAEFLRSLGFGALLGAGLLGLVYLFFPQAMAASVSLEDVLLIGGLAGTGLHSFIDRAINQTFLRPLVRFLSYYVKLVQLLAIGRFLGTKRQTELLRQLTEEHLLGGSSHGAQTRSDEGKLLPPGA